MGQLVGGDSPQLVAIQRLDDAPGESDRRVVRIAAGGKGVGLLLRNDIHRGHRQVGPPGQFFNHLVQLGVAVPVDLLGPVHLQYHLVGIPVAEEVHAHRKDKGDNQSGGTAEYVSDQHEKDGHKCHQKYGSYTVPVHFRKLWFGLSKWNAEIFRNPVTCFLPQTTRCRGRDPGPGPVYRLPV